MATGKKNPRQSISFSTPQQLRRSPAASRRSMSKLDTENTDASKAVFSQIMGDPFKKTLFLKFLSYNQTTCRDVLERIKKRQGEPVVEKSPPQSPMMLHRKRALAAMQAAEQSSGNASSQKKYSRANVPFNKLLQGVVAYVEIISQHQNRSAGVKALLKTMGAKVSEQIQRGITHAIIKDVPYDTYRKANLVKAHLVSVLWLEAVRKNHCRVPEKHFPALGPEADASNVSILCEELQKDYAEVVQDELERSRNLQRTIRCNLSTKFAEEDVIDTSQDCDTFSMISGVNRICQESRVQKTVKELELENIPPEVSSDSESDMGLVNGQILEKKQNTTDHLTESSGCIEHSVINSLADKLKDFSDSSSLPSANTSPVRKLVDTPLVNTRRGCGTRGKVNIYDLNSSNDDDFQQRKSLARNKQKPKRSPEKSKERSVTRVPDEGNSSRNENAVEQLSNLPIKKSNRSNHESTLNDDSCEALDVLSELQVSNLSKKGKARSSELRLSKSHSKNSPKGQAANLQNNSTEPENFEVSSELKVTNTKNKRRVSNRLLKQVKEISGDESVNLRLSSTSNKESVGISEPAPPLRISAANSKRRTTESSALSSLRISTESGKSRKEPVGVSESVSSASNKESVGVSEPVPSLRISPASSKRRTTESSALSSLRISTESTKSRKEPLGTSESVSSVPDKESVGVSEPVPSLRISAASSKRRTTESSALSSLRISTESSKSRKEPVGVFESVSSPSNKESVGVSEPVPSLRKSAASSKRRTTESSALSSLRISTESSKSRKDTAGASESVSSLRVSPDNSKQSATDIIKARKRKLYDPNNPDQGDIFENNTNKNVEIAPVLMTPSAWKLVQQKLPSMVNTDKEKENKKTGPCSPSKKTKIPDDHKIKTPRKPVKPTKSTAREKTPQTTPSRRSMRINSQLESRSDASSQNDRRSTLLFLPKESFRTPTKIKLTQLKPRKVRSIVCSRFHSNEVEVFAQIVKKLGVFFIEDEVTDKTSHLVLGEPKRTVNVLRGLARGCWILKPEWLYRSLEEGKWLPEEDYEMTEYSLAVEKSRCARQAFGRSYSMDVFSGCGNLYVAKSSTPRCSDLQELIRTCKGKVTTIQRNASVIVGEYVKGDFVCVSVNWLLDSITFYKTQSVKKYLLEPPKESG